MTLQANVCAQDISVLELLSATACDPRVRMSTVTIKSHGDVAFVRPGNRKTPAPSLRRMCARKRHTSEQPSVVRLLASRWSVGGAASRQSKTN